MKKIEEIWLPEVQQQVFRSLMEVMSRPGKTESLNEVADNSALRALLATLMDAEVTLADHGQLLDDSDWPLLQCQQRDVESADYLVCSGEQTPDFEPKLGTLASPEYAATIVLKVDSVQSGNQQCELSGPGINGTQTIAFSGLNRAWLEQREEWNAAFPLGIDILLVDDKHVMALPRTTRIEVTSWDM